MEKKDKKFNRKIFLLITIAVVVVFAGLLICIHFYMQGINSKSNNNISDIKVEEEFNVNKDEEKEENKEEEQQNKEEKIIEEQDNTIYSEFNKFLNENIFNNYFHTYVSKDYNDLNELDNQNKLWLAYWTLKDDRNHTYIVKYTSDEILTKMQSIYGKKFNILFEDMKFGDTVIYKYNSSTKKYENAGGGGGLTTIKIKKIVPLEYKFENNKYYVTYIPAFVYSGEDSIYSNIIDINTYESISNKQYSYEDEMTDNDFEEIKDKLTKVTYIFERENGKLVLTGYLIGK